MERLPDTQDTSAIQLSRNRHIVAEILNQARARLIDKDDTTRVFCSQKINVDEMAINLIP
jgi:hypothetical protein